MRNTCTRTAAVAAGLLSVAAFPGCEKIVDSPKAPSVETATFHPDYLATQNPTVAYTVDALLRRPDDYLGRRIEFSGGLRFVGNDIPPVAGERSTKYLYSYTPDHRTALVVLSGKELPTDVNGVRGTWVKHQDQYYMIADEAKYNSWNLVRVSSPDSGK